MKLFKWLSLGFMFVAPITVIIIYFYDRQSASVGWNFAGITATLIMLVITFSKFKEWLLIKKAAKETATNLGKTSKNYNSIVINLLTYVYLASPFGLLLWLNVMIEKYEGNIAWPIILILSSFAVSCIFNILFEALEQKAIAEQELKEQDDQVKAIGDYVASEIGG
jgi:MFS family permease